MDGPATALSVLGDGAETKAGEGALADPGDGRGTDKPFIGDCGG